MILWLGFQCKHFCFEVAVGEVRRALLSNALTRAQIFSIVSHDCLVNLQWWYFSLDGASSGRQAHTQKGAWEGTDRSMAALIRDNYVARLSVWERWSRFPKKKRRKFVGGITLAGFVRYLESYWKGWREVREPIFRFSQKIPHCACRGPIRPCKVHFWEILSPFSPAYQRCNPPDRGCGSFAWRQAISSSEEFLGKIVPCV